VDKNIQTILVTSSTPGEGKTTTLLNLATAMAQNGEKVLVIDCDMRKSRVHKALEISNKKGLADYLLSSEDLKSYIQTIPELQLDVITSGHIPTNPSELLHSKKMINCLLNLKSEYDYIFLDTPPVLPVTDAVVIGSYIDGVVLVVSSGNVEIDLAKKAKEALISVGANILGVVLNRIPVDDPKTYQSYYYYYSTEEEVAGE
jgi:capsular exopolysaccharide synthesis family protein